jgi:cysteine protease ATG4
MFLFKINVSSVNSFFCVYFSGWRWYDEKPTTARLYNEDVCHRKIIKWFGDNPSWNSPFSIHMLVTLGETTGKKAGDWYGPGSVSHLLRWHSLNHVFFFYF